MALTRAALKEMGVTEKEIIDAIMEAHGNTVESAKEKEKETANKASEKLQATIDAMQKQLDNAPKPNPDGKDWKAEYDTLAASAVDKSGKTYKELHDALKSDFDTFKQTIENEKITDAKKSALHKKLQADGANPKLTGLLAKEFDLSKIEVDGDGIKDWDNISKSVKEQYADVFNKNETQQKDSAVLPLMSTATGKQALPSVTAYTMEQIKKMTPDQINANWNTGVKQTLQKG